jgi:hypothetical protein
MEAGGSVYPVVCGFRFLPSSGEKKEHAGSKFFQSVDERHWIFIIFIPCTFGNQFTALRPTKCTILSLKYLFYNITLNIPTCFDF